jgi:hypothetical protein
MDVDAVISNLTDFRPGDFVYIGMEQKYGIVTHIEESYVFVKRQYTMQEVKVGLFKPEYLQRVRPEGRLLELFNYLQSNPI